MLEADAVVAGLGIEPNVTLAADAGLSIGNGIAVDDRGRVTGRDDVFAAGDVACFPATLLGAELRVEHEDHAKSHGAHVGRSMAGADEPYDRLPFFYSDSSTWATRRSARSTRGTRRWSNGSSRTARASSATWTAKAGRAGSCSGTSGARWTTHVS